MALRVFYRRSPSCLVTIRLKILSIAERTLNLICFFERMCYKLTVLDVLISLNSPEETAEISQRQRNDASQTSSEILYL